MLLNFGCPLWFFLEEDGIPDGGGSGRRLCFACRLWSGWAGNFASFADCGVDSGGLTDTAPAGSIRTLRGLYAYLCISFYSNQNFFLDIDLYNSWTQSSFFKLCYDFFFVFVSESFNCNTKFYGCFTIDADKLIVFQFDNISVCFCNDGSYAHKFARSVRKKYGYGKDTASLDKSLLYNR